MMTKEEVERAAQAINALRPDWPLPSLITFLRSKDRWKRPARDLTLELVYVALDPETKTPARIDEKGPWKFLYTASGGSASAFIRPPAPYDCDVCRRPQSSPHLDHEYVQRDANGYGTPLPEPKREALAESMAATHLALTAAPEDEAEETT